MRTNIRTLNLGDFISRKCHVNTLCISTGRNTFLEFQGDNFI